MTLAQKQTVESLRRDGIVIGDRQTEPPLDFLHIGNNPLAVDG